MILPRYTFETKYDGSGVSLTTVSPNVNHRWFSLGLSGRSDLIDKINEPRLTTFIDCSTMSGNQYILFSIKDDFAEACPETLRILSQVHDYHKSGEATGQIKSFSIWLEGITNDEYLIGLLAV